MPGTFARKRCVREWRRLKTYVEDVVGDVDLDGGAVLLGHWRHENGVPEEELRIDRVGGRFVGIEEPEWIEGWNALHCLLVKRRIKVVEQPIADVDGVSCGGSDTLPAVKLLRDGVDSVMNLSSPFFSAFVQQYGGVWECGRHLRKLPRHVLARDV